jgi:hypothetical protein
MAIVTYTAEEAKKLKSDTDWDSVEKMTEEEVHQAALDDPDCVVSTEEDLKKFTRGVHRGGGIYGYDKSKNIKQRASAKTQR